MKNFGKVILLAAAAAISYAGFLAWRAHQNLVTFHVRNAPLAKVLASLRWQTWEKFVVHSGIEGTVSLDVDRMPLDGVLGILGEQLNARWSTLYPIYRDKTSLVSLQRALRGEVKFDETKFTNFQARPMGPGGDGPMRNVQPVTLHLTNIDLALGAMALERFGGGQVIVEKGTSPKITLELSSASFEKAVSKVARAAKSSSTRLYALQRGRGPEGMAGRGEGRPSAERDRPPNPEADSERLAKMQEVLQTLPEEDRKRAEERQLERMAMQSLTPEQRQQVMAERMNSPEMQVRAEQRAVTGIKNTTPEQRRERYERMYEMRKARAAAAGRNG